MRTAVSFFLAFFLFAAVHAAVDIMATYQKYQEAWKQKDYKTVMEVAEKLKAAASGNSSVQFAYARALAVNSKTAEAIKVLQSIAKMGGSPPAKDDEAFAALKSNSDFQQILKIYERNRSAFGRSEVAVVVPGKDFIAEGIAYDPVDKKFYLGSTYRRKIVEFDLSGKVSDFASEKQDGLWGMVGMEVDASRRHLWANTANGGAHMWMMDAEESSVGRTAVLKYDLRTKKLIKKYEAGSKESPHFFNDVAIAANGDVYISESTGGQLYKISAKTDKLELMLSRGSIGFPNGLAISPDGKYLYVSHMAGIAVIELASGANTPLTGPPDTQLGNHDGLVFYRNSLIGLQGLTGSVDRIVRLHLQNPRQVSHVEVLEANHPLFALPTTGDMAGDEFYYIANSQLRSFDEKGNIFPAEKLNDTIILKADLLESEKEELRAVHRDGLEAHLKTDVNRLLKDGPDEFVTVSSGKIDRVSREQERQFFEEYFRNATYSEYTDIEDPIVSVSDDGRSGYVISRTRVRRTQGGKKQEFVYAGIMTYEKLWDRWIRVANVSTFEINKPAES